VQVSIPIKTLSVNAAFQGRRFKTKECKAYENELWYLLPKMPMVKGEVEMTLELFMKKATYSRADVSNQVKVLEDILTKKGYYEDDRKIVSLHVHKYLSDKSEARITITEA
jgi:Holliday junction resolvase RusA-like endonuclease